MTTRTSENQRHCDFVSCLVGNVTVGQRYFLSLKYKQGRLGAGDTHLELHLSLPELLDIRDKIDQAVERELKALRAVFRDGVDYDAAIATVAHTDREAAVRKAELLMQQENERLQLVARLAAEVESSDRPNEFEGAPAL